MIDIYESPEGAAATQRLAAAAHRLRVGGFERGRVRVIGTNRAGKSTLLRVIAGRLNPAAGASRVGGLVGYLTQHPEPWSAQWLAAQGIFHAADREPSEELGQLLSLGLFRRAELLQRFEDISLGRRRWLDVPRMFARPAQLLLLDEQSDHLSPAPADEREKSLAESAATVVLIGHDRALQTRFAGQRIHWEHGRIIR